MKPKEYLVSIGAIDKVGRGRLSAAHIELCKEGAAKGISIEGYSVSTAPVTSTDDKPKTVVTKSAPSGEKVISDFVILYDEREFKAIERTAKVERSMREACGNCRVSLVQCTCGAPAIVARDASGSVRVDIVRR